MVLRFSRLSYQRQHVEGSNVMFTPLASVLLCLPMATGPSEDRVENLPSPHYHRQAADPPWLGPAVQLHGHLGPMLTFGARMGMAALKAVEAKGYFDVEVRCEGPMAKPPASCFLDGLQISTGATLGKRNLQWVDSKTILVHVKNTRTGKTATVQPKEEFLTLLRPPEAAAGGGRKGGTSKQSDDEHFEQLARRIAVMPEAKILTVTLP
jgi:formylmethanofuran dehydrogenase subunit E